MLKEIKLAFKLVRFGLQFKLSSVLGILFLVFGIVIEIKGGGEDFLGSFYLAMSTMFIYQLIYSVDVSKLVQSSGHKRKIQLKYPYMAMLPVIFLAFTVIVVEHSVLAMNGSAPAQGNVVFSNAIILAFILIYFGIAFKFMIVATLLFIVFVCVAVTAMEIVTETASIVNVLSWPQIIVVSYLILLLGAIISFLIAKIFYKREISEAAFKNAIARELK